jgi:hypothetical protein
MAEHWDEAQRTSRAEAEAFGKQIEAAPSGPESEPVNRVPLRPTAH